MFLSFFYHLRSHHLLISSVEWLDLLAALDKGLCRPSLVEFYYLCRAVLIKSEADYDRFDQAFSDYFKGVESKEEIPLEFFEWLEQGQNRSKEALYSLWDQNRPTYDLEHLKELLAERLKEQKEKHEGGNYWIATGGSSHFGHGGYAEQGIRIGGESRYRSALQIAQQREFRDFRQDQIIDPRQFQVALRKLRQYSSGITVNPSLLDVEETIDATSDNGGFLKLVYERPRKNAIKLLLLFDSAGSMLLYSRLCSTLFHAVNTSNHFSDLKVYYFHNCIYEHLYTDPGCRRGSWVDTNWVFLNFGSEYRVVIVGDGTMAPSELFSPGGNCMIGLYNSIPGIEWLNSVKSHYAHHIWLNPIPKNRWNTIYGRETLNTLTELFPMYELSVEGLEAGIKKLLVNR